MHFRVLEEQTEETYVPELLSTSSALAFNPSLRDPRAGSPRTTFPFCQRLRVWLSQQEYSGEAIGLEGRRDLFSSLFLPGWFLSAMCDFLATSWLTSVCCTWLPVYFRGDFCLYAISCLLPVWFPVYFLADFCLWCAFLSTSCVISVHCVWLPVCLLSLWMLPRDTSHPWGSGSFL